MSVSKLVRHYLEWAATYYVKDDAPSHEIGHLKSAAKELLADHACTDITAFGPLALKQVRQRMVHAGWTRGYVNHQVQRVRRIFKWGVENELIRPHVLHGLQTVSGLREGRTKAREAPPILPTTDEAVNAVLRHVSPQVVAMIRLQRLTGMRSDNLCAMKPQEIDRTGDVWKFEPQSHKTKYRGRRLCVMLGPKAQKVLKPFLKGRPANAFVFSPAEVMEHRSRERRKNRQTPMTPSQRARKRNRSPQKRPGLKYTPHSYCRAITTAAKKAGSAKWTPLQLRHLRQTEVRRDFGLEAAQVILGHARADVTQIYAERDFEKAAAIARATG